MADRKVLVKNMINGTVVFVVENANFKRSFKGEGAKAYIPFEILFEGLSQEGAMFLFTDGILAIDNKQDRIDLGLEFEDEPSQLDHISMDSAKMLEIMKANNPVTIKETLEQLSTEQRKKFAQVAVENKIYTASLAKFIKDYTGIDLMKCIQELDDESEDN